MKETTSPSGAHDGARDKAVEGLSLLGNKRTVYAQDYDPSVLEAFENKHQDRDYRVRFECPEFTALCPITGQPDFATIYIEYVPDVRMVESKSLKLYLFSFRSHGAFHEDCVNIIIVPFCNYGRPGTPYESYARERMLAFHH